MFNRYNPNTFNYDPAPGVEPSRAAWIDVFRRSIPEFFARAASDDSVVDSTAKAERFRAAFTAALAALELVPEHEERSDSPLCCTLLCDLRDKLLRDEGFADCFASVKACRTLTLRLVQAYSKFSYSRDSFPFPTGEGECRGAAAATLHPGRSGRHH